MKSGLILLCSLAAALTFNTTVRAEALKNSNPTDAQPQQDFSSAIVVLKGDPISTYAKTKPAQGKKIDFNSASVKAYRAQLNTLRNQFRKWLAAAAPKATINGKFDIALNAVSLTLNGATLDSIRTCPLVKDAQYETYYYPTVENPDLGLIHAIQAWQAGGGPANAGTEVKVAIIDSGIDIRHPCFSDAGYPAKQRLGDRRFTNNKVIAAKVFSNRAVSLGYTAEAINDHGTHVAGIVGCDFNTPASVSGVTIPFGISGVAPRVLLGNYNVFPAQVPGARNEDILSALEAAYEDGFDVANMSLGGRNRSGRLGAQDVLTVAVDNLDQADMVVAVAAGNSGPGFDTVESPGSAARALTAGASSVPHYLATPVTVNGQVRGALIGDFAPLTNDIVAPLAVVANASNGLGMACSVLPAGSLAGKIALISRGSCTFSTKARDARDAGAIAVLIVNNAAGDPILIGGDGTPDQPALPVLMLTEADGLALLTADGATATISGALGYFQTPNADFMADFSSQGPTEVDFRVKPDVVAPGEHVLSSIPVSFCGGQPCFAFFDGTSMAAPHLAGSAAILRWLYPNWTAAQIRSAIVNTADKAVLKQASGALETNLNITGAGRENLLAAINAVVTLDPVSVSFGAVPSGSGQSAASTVSLKNVSAGSMTISISIPTGDSSVSYFVSPSSLTLAAGQTGQANIIMSAAKGSAPGNHQTLLSLSANGSEVAHAVVYTLIK
jgi:minor extracellular serine protease Vpr